jgi:hypothetical protein
LLVASFEGFSQHVLVLKGLTQIGTSAQAGRFKNAYGIGAQYDYHIKKSPIHLAANLDYGINGWKTAPITLQFGNRVTKTDVVYMSSASSLTGGATYVCPSDNKLNPFAGLQVGALMYNTNMTIEDPNDPLGCRALESRQVSTSWSFITKAETGVRMNIGKKHNDAAFLQLAVGYTVGTKADYLSLGEKQAKSDAREYNTKFQSRETGEVHDHSLGKVYSTPTNLLSVSFGVGIRL